MFPSRVGGCIRVHDFNLVLSESFGPLDFGPIKNYINHSMIFTSGLKCRLRKHVCHEAVYRRGANGNYQEELEDPSSASD